MSEFLTTVEKDAKSKAYARLVNVKNARGGRFKLTEAQFIKELSDMWIIGEFSAAERILRHIEMDDSINNKDLIRGEIHVFMMDVLEILKKRIVIGADFKKGDLIGELIWGKYSTEKIREQENQQQ